MPEKMDIEIFLALNCDKKRRVHKAPPVAPAGGCPAQWSGHELSKLRWCWQPAPASSISAESPVFFGFFARLLRRGCGKLDKKPADGEGMI